mmetsp:Transcript_3974/g.4464  ORF Transcript_3974/g.4464 Transcript_3974/m.4464 type:complete len:476 (-) Transcript_3974:709-2136(-)
MIVMEEKNVQQTPCTSSTARYKRTCEGCTAAKVKCSGTPVCTRCERRKIPCVFRKQLKRGRKSALSFSRDQYGSNKKRADGTILTSTPTMQPFVVQGNVPVRQLYFQDNLQQNANISPLQPVVNPLIQSTYNLSGSQRQQGIPLQRPFMYAPKAGQSRHASNIPSLYRFSPQNLAANQLSYQPVSLASSPHPLPGEFQKLSQESFENEVTKVGQEQRKVIESLISFIGKRKFNNNAASSFANPLVYTLHLLKKNGSSAAAKTLEAWLASRFPTLNQVTNQLKSLQIVYSDTLNSRISANLLAGIGLHESNFEKMPYVQIVYNTSSSGMCTDVAISGNNCFRNNFSVEKLMLYTKFCLGFGGDLLGGILTKVEDLVHILLLLESKSRRKNCNYCEDLMMSSSICSWKDNNSPGQTMDVDTVVRSVFRSEKVNDLVRKVEIIHCFEKQPTGSSLPADKTQKQTSDSKWIAALLSKVS